MPGRYLIDTSVAVEMLVGRVSARQALARGGELLISSITVGELLFGARKSRQTEANIAHIEALLAEMPVLSVNTNSARHYGALKDILRRKGKMIPDNDLWIAALAIQHDLILVTRDKHFQEVDNIICEQWQ